MKIQTALPLLASLCLQCAIANATGVGPVSYTVATVPMISGVSAMIGTAINAHGDVAGYAYLSRGGSQAYAFINGAVELIPTLGGLRNSASGINDAGQVVGWSETSNAAEYRPFLYTQSGEPINLGTLGGRQSMATAINNGGVISGYSTVRLPYNDEYGSFTTTATTPPVRLNISPLVGSDSFAYAINNAGVVAGTLYAPDRSRSSAFIQTGANTQVLQTLGGNYASAVSINELGQVVGSSAIANGDGRAFLFNGTSVENLGTISGQANLGHGLGTPSYSGATGINSSSTIVGTFGYSGYQGRGFVYMNGSMLDLNNLLSPGESSIWEITDAMAINNDGVIVAYGYKPGQLIGTTLLLTPSAVPENSSALLLIIGLLGVILQRTRAFREQFDERTVAGET